MTDNSDPITALDELDEFGGDHPIGPLVSEALITIPAHASVRDVARQLDEASVGVVIVGDRDRVEAVVSERDIVRAVAAGSDLDQATATDIGNQELRWIPSTATVADAIDEMMTGYHRHLLVRGGSGHLTGVLSIRDLLTAYPT